MRYRLFPRLVLPRIALAVAMLLGLLPALPALAATPTVLPPSTLCHVTDGAFTVCPDGRAEWSDVPPVAFPQSNSFLYAAQADLDPNRRTPTAPVDTFMLMYDECALTTPLGPNEYFLVSFKTVEVVNGKEKLVHYVLHLFTDGRLIFIEDGVPHPAGRTRQIEGQRGAVGFGKSPNCNVDHVVAEFQIELSEAGGHSYSPDPLFWSSDPPPCSVPPLSPITDPIAQEYERAAPNTPLRLDLVDTTLVAGINAFIADVAGQMGLNLRISSAFRPTAYQAHLYELRTKKIALRNLNAQQQQACRDLTAAVDAEIARHGLQTDAAGIPIVARPGTSKHETGGAIDLGPRTAIRGLSAAQRAQFDRIARDHGLVRPVAGDIVHFTLTADGAALNVEAHSPINILVQSATGQRVGFDPTLRAAVNDLGSANAFYSGPGTEPQIVTIDGANPGSFLVSGIGTADGHYSIDVGLIDEDSEAINTQLFDGTASAGAPIAPIRVTIAPDGEIATEVLPPPPPPPASRNIISSGVVQLGVNPEGHLNVGGGSPSSGTGTTFVGLRYLPTGAESTAPGCLCEGWGVADAVSGVAGFANQAVDGVRNISLLSFASTASTAVSTTQVGNTFKVTHDYHPSASPNLFEATVTIENIGRADVDLRYRRVMDWDVEPTAFSEFVTVVTIQGTARAENVLFASDNGFASANPLAGPSSLLFTGDAVDSGPADHGALFDFGFGTLPAGGTFKFNIYYGAAATEAEALAALATVRAEVYSFGQPNTPDGPTLGKPNTFVFAFRNVGGGPVVPLDTDKDGVVDELDNCPRSPNADQRDSNFNGIGNACETPQTQHASAGFLQAGGDGGVVAEARSLTVADEPALVEELVRIVDFRLRTGRATGASQLTNNLVDSQVALGLVSPQDASSLVRTVLQQVDAVPPVTTASISPDPNANGWNRSEVTVLLTAVDNDGGSGVKSLTYAASGAMTIATTTVNAASASVRISAEGTTTLTYGAADNTGNAEAPKTLTVKVDTTPPQLACTVGPSLLWPPNHRLSPVTARVQVTDAASGPGGFTLTAVTSSEPDDGLGDGDTLGDIQGFAVGTADLTGELRAERSGGGTGRIYTLTYRGQDQAGNTATCQATVTVPHDRRA